MPIQVIWGNDIHTCDKEVKAIINKAEQILKSLESSNNFHNQIDLKTLQKKAA